MSDITVRPFARPDRDQLAELVNRHAAAVVPGVSVSVATLLSRLERDPGEFIVDPWVGERLTLVAEQRGRVVGAAHLQRYRSGADVPEHVRGSGGITWLVFSPNAPFWPDSERAGDALADAAVRVLREWRATAVHADGDLPAPGVYGVPEQWPHVRTALTRAGFTSAGRTETVWIAAVDALPASSAVRLDAEPQLHRTLGTVGTRLSAELDGRALGYIELDTALDGAERSPRGQALADIGNLWVEPEFRRRGVGRWLLAGARHWLDLAGVSRLLTYTELDDESEAAFYTATGFEPLTTTVRDYRL